MYYDYGKNTCVNLLAVCPFLHIKCAKDSISIIESFIKTHTTFKYNLKLEYDDEKNCVTVHMITESNTPTSARFQEDYILMTKQSISFQLYDNDYLVFEDYNIYNERGIFTKHNEEQFKSIFMQLS